MTPPPDFRLKKPVALAALISASLPAAGIDGAGQVDFVIGNVQSESSDGTVRDLTKGAIVRSGDLVKTRAGRAHIRFSDGAYVSLKPDTEFRIDEYRFDEKKPEEQSGFFSLFKGSLRTITGLIGRNKREAYQIRTSVATIGIRGTHFLVSIVGGNLIVSNYPGFHAGLVDLFNQLTNSRLETFPDGTKVTISEDGAVEFDVPGAEGEIFSFSMEEVSEALEELAPEDDGDETSTWQITTTGTFDNLDDVLQEMVDGGEGYS